MAVRRHRHRGTVTYCPHELVSQHSYLLTGAVRRDFPRLRDVRARDLETHTCTYCERVSYNYEQAERKTKRFSEARTQRVNNWTRRDNEKKPLYVFPTRSDARNRAIINVFYKTQHTRARARLYAYTLAQGGFSARVMRCCHRGCFYPVAEYAPSCEGRHRRLIDSSAADAVAGQETNQWRDANTDELYYYVYVETLKRGCHVFSVTSTM